MKKKYRRAVYLIASTPVYAVAIPFAVISVLCDWVSDRAFDVAGWLEDKLKIYGFKD